MPGITAEHNVEGHFKRLISICETSVWREVWSALSLELKPFSELGLVHDSSDATVWETCQAHEVIHITANRNNDGPDSLEAIITANNQPASLPVITFADADRILESRPYAELVVERLLEILLDIENLRGTGRLYVP